MEVFGGEGHETVFSVMVRGKAGLSARERLAARRVLVKEILRGSSSKCWATPAISDLSAKDRFIIDTGAGTVTCPAEISVPIRPAKAGGGTAAFGTVCAACPLAAECTASRAGRTSTISRYEAELVGARETQKDLAWRGEYRATRPKVERKIGHLMRRKHGGRRARVSGRSKVGADFSLLAAAVNIARLGVLRISHITPHHPTRTGRTVAGPPTVQP